MPGLLYDIKDLSLADKGQRRINWSGQHMPVLAIIGKRLAQENPFTGITIGACLHITAETANLLKVLKQGGAKVFVCASNPLSTQDEVAASLVYNDRIAVFAIKGEDPQTYYGHVNMVLSAKPNITIDDGADLVTTLHKFKIQNSKSKLNPKFQIQNRKGEKWDFFGSLEETTTGVKRLKSMQRGALKIPVIAVNDSQTKHFFDNRYGTGQSTIDGILRATNLLLAGKKFVVCGYGFCGKGLAMRASGMGAKVIVTEIDPVRALQAVMDGFTVKSLNDALEQDSVDFIVTVTGNKHVVDREHLTKMKDGTILANSGHFNVEINLQALKQLAKRKRRIREFIDEYILADDRKIYLLGEGRLINLVAAEGHPPEVMDLSFANQALAAEWLVKKRGKLLPKVYTLPTRLDREIAQLKLKAMGIKIDRLTNKQKKYLKGWEEGT